MDKETRLRIVNMAQEHANNEPYFDQAQESYIAGATAEHSRITELLKEKDERIAELLDALNLAFRNMNINVPSVQSSRYAEWEYCKVIMKAAIEKVKGKQQ